MERKWFVYDLIFDVVGIYDSQEDASKSIGTSRQTANKSFRSGKPIFKQFYICQPGELIDLYQRSGSIKHDSKSNNQSA